MKFIQKLLERLSDNKEKILFGNSDLGMLMLCLGKIRFVNQDCVDIMNYFEEGISK